MGRVADLNGGTFHVSFNLREGRNTTADFIGNKIDVQEIYGDGNNFRLAELSYEQILLGNILNLKTGFTVMGDDFGRTGLLCDFENDAFCAHANSLPTNSGWSDYPAGKWGGRGRVNLPDDIYAEIGLYDVNPTYSEHDNGFKVSLQGSTGALIPIEISKTIALGPATLLGHYKIGGYFDSSEAPELGYGLQATPWMLLHPNVQYIGNPGAFSFKHVPDAWVFGFQTKLIF